MFWQEEDDKREEAIPDDVVDLLFAVDCKRLPVDHAYALSAAIREAAPWVADEASGIGIHSFHVAGSQNGWERPEHGSDQCLILSRRTKLVIRTPRARLDELTHALGRKTLLVAGFPMKIGQAKTRPLSRETTLFTRHLPGPPEMSEEDFLGKAIQDLAELGVRSRKAICGKSLSLATPEGPVHTRSLMLASLGLTEAILLQRKGLGPLRSMGCGIFIPHKGVAPVDKPA